MIPRALRLCKKALDNMYKSKYTSHDTGASRLAPKVTVRKARCSSIVSRSVQRRGPQYCVRPVFCGNQGMERTQRPSMQWQVLSLAASCTINRQIVPALVAGFEDYALKSAALLERSKPMIKPNSPRTELKISMTKILTNLYTMSVSILASQTTRPLTSSDLQHRPEQHCYH